MENEDSYLEEFEDEEFEFETEDFDFSTFRQQDDYEIASVPLSKRILEFLLWLVKHIPLLTILILLPFGLLVTIFGDKPSQAGIAIFSFYLLCLLGIYIRLFYKALCQLKTETRKKPTSIGTLRFREISNYSLYYTPEKQRHRLAIQIFLVSTGLFLLITSLMLYYAGRIPIFYAILLPLLYTWACRRAYLAKTSTPKKIEERYWNKQANPWSWWYRYGTGAFLLLSTYASIYGESEPDCNCPNTIRSDTVDIIDRIVNLIKDANYGSAVFSIIIAAILMYEATILGIGFGIFLAAVYGFYIAFQFAPIATTIVATLIWGAVIIIRAGNKRETL